MDTQTAKAQTTNNGHIEQSQWKQYLTDFTSRNQNRQARLEILGDEIGAEEAAADVPFMMASLEEKGSDKGDALITLGGTSADNTNQILHVVRGVVSITAQIENDGSESALEIAGAEEKAILAFN